MNIPDKFKSWIYMVVLYLDIDYLLKNNYFSFLFTQSLDIFSSGLNHLWHFVSLGVVDSV
jgi:hypothetical protein